MWDTPPVEYRKITCFALPGKCGRFGASGSCRASSASSGWSRPGSSSEPPASERRKVRRLQLSDIDELIRAEQDAGETLPGLGLAEARPGLRDVALRGRGFSLRGGPAERQGEAALDAVRVVLALLLQAHGEGLGLLVDEGVVEHVERLQRR